MNKLQAEARIHTMAHLMLLSSDLSVPLSPETMVTKGRRSRTSFTEEQLEILVQAFSQNPYPGYTAKQRLAVEINAEESRIQVHSRFQISRTVKLRVEQGAGDLSGGPVAKTPS